MAKKILIVDDEPDSVSFISSILEDNGYDSISSRTGVGGMELARKEKPDLILLDLIMPEKGGIRMFQELKRDTRLSRIPVIVVTGMSRITGVDFRNVIRKQEGEAGEESSDTILGTPDGFVEKPVDPSELVKAIEDILEE
ncbi:MAG: response regulator [Deltaproteobacteria bacterium]